MKSALLYGPETWRSTKLLIKKLQTFINMCLRKILNIRWPEVIANEKPWGRTHRSRIEESIKRRKWKWIGHMLRKPENSRKDRCKYFQWAEEEPSFRRQKHPFYHVDTQEQIPATTKRGLRPKLPRQNPITEGAMEDMVAKRDFPPKEIVNTVKSFSFVSFQVIG